MSDTAIGRWDMNHFQPNILTSELTYPTSTTGGCRIHIFLLSRKKSSQYFNH
jgi:hypothetical protein